MTAQVDPYVRVYYRIVDDPKFLEVYDDKPTLGWWLTLLISADASHPAPANLPRRIPKNVVAKLVKVGLIDLVGNDRYRMHGLASERENRAEAARFAADVKHHGIEAALRMQSARTAEGVRPQPVGSAETVPLRSAPLLSEPNQRGSTDLKIHSKKPEHISSVLGRNYVAELRKAQAE